MAKFFGTYIESKRLEAIKYAGEWQGVIYSGLVFGATMTVMFWASVFLYTSFYFTYMPQESVTWPIHFRYKSCENIPGICSNPEAIVSVTDPTRGSLLARGQKYRIVVDIEMPESPVNQRLGMFLIDMGMKSHSGELMRHSSRSAMLRYRSPLLQTLATTMFAPFLLYGVNEEKQMVTVELFSQYEEDPVTPLSEVHVELATRHIELYAAQLRIHATFSGLRYFMYHYPLTAATVGIGICMVFLSAVVILSWYQFSEPNAKLQMNIKPPVSNGQLLVGSKGIVNADDKMLAPRGSISRRRSSASKRDQEKSSTESNIKVDGEKNTEEVDITKRQEDLDMADDSNLLPEAERRDSDDFEIVRSTTLEAQSHLEVGKLSRRGSEARSDEEVGKLSRRGSEARSDEEVGKFSERTSEGQSDEELGKRSRRSSEARSRRSSEVRARQTSEVVDGSVLRQRVQTVESDEAVPDE